MSKTLDHYCKKGLEFGYLSLYQAVTKPVKTEVAWINYAITFQYSLI